jgi:hypothetical protein
MKNILHLLFILVLAFTSCNKSKPQPENIVVYTVVENSKNSPEYTVTYSTPQGDKTDGPIIQSSWLSKQLSLFERGDFVALSIETKSGTGSFTSSVYLNGVLVTDKVALENYWDRTLPIFVKEQIELQAHGTYVAYRNIYIRELPSNEPTVLSDLEKQQGFKQLFDGTHLDNWVGNKAGYLLQDGSIMVNPKSAGGGNLYTKEQYSDFEYRFEFQLTPGANNGLGIRAPLEGDAAYVGMELQILDNDADIYKNLKPYQYHGSIYGVVPARRGFLRPNGEWNEEVVLVKGTRVKVILNGETITDADIKEASINGTMDHNEHPGLKRTSGHIGFLGHGDVVRFRNIRILPL